MNHSMINSAASLSGLQQRLDIIANNISNMNTAGYKRRDATFQDLLSTYKQQEQTMQLPGRMTPLGMSEGWGTRLAMQTIDFSQGVLVETGHPLDVAIEGNALFEIAVGRLNADGTPAVDPDGVRIYDTVWMRQGAFQLTMLAGDDEHMYLATDNGTLLFTGAGNEPVPIPKEYNRIVIDSEGTITAYNPMDEYVEAGQLKLAKVLKPELMVGIGDHRYALAPNADEADVLERLTTADENISIRQGYIEQSNVNVSKEMVELMTVQRAYQLSARALASADSMMNMANNLRG